MATSQNGWPLVAAGSPQVETLAGVPTGPVALAGPVAQLLRYVAVQFNARVEAITSTSSHRPGATIGSTGRYSNHASATAIDLNGGRHPQFARGTFTPAQVSEIRAILGSTQVIDWGGDWGDASVDEMHFEIRPGTTTQQAADAAGALNQEDDMTPAQAAQLSAIHDLFTAGQAGVKSEGDILARLRRLEAKADAVGTSVWGYKNAAINGTRDVYGVVNAIKTKVGA